MNQNMSSIGRHYGPIFLKNGAIVTPITTNMYMYVVDIRKTSTIHFSTQNKCKTGGQEIKSLCILLIWIN